MTLFAVTKVWYDYEVAQWAESDEQEARYLYFMTYLFILAVLNSFFVFLRVVTISTFSWHATSRLHDRMVERVLNAPINLYFDRTPVGRILNRFSKDLQAADSQMWFLIGNMHLSFYTVLSVLVIAVVAVYWIVFIFPVFLVIAIWLFRQAIAAIKETVRIESTTKSPILSLFGETIQGAPTIRTFGRTE